MQKGYLVSLYAALGFITLLVLLTKGHPVLVRKKVFLGLLILSLTAPAASLVSCKSGGKSIVQKDVWHTEGWYDEDTYRIYSSGMPKDGLTNKIQRKGTARESAILLAQKNIMEKFKPVRSEACADYSLDNYTVSKELAGIIKGGTIIAERFDDEENCEIMYEVKSKGLKKIVLGAAYNY